MAMPARRTLYLLRRDGIVILRHPAREAEVGRSAPAQSPWHAMVANGGGAYHAAALFDDTRVIASVHVLPDLPFVIEASVTEADTLSERYQQRLLVVLGCFSAILSAIGLLRLFASQYRRLKRSERALAAKNQELDTAHRQLETTLANLSQGVSLYDDNYRLLVFNQQFCELYKLSDKVVRPGMSLAEIAELRISSGCYTRQSADTFLASAEAGTDAGKPWTMNVELADGRIICNHIQPLPDRGWVITHEDITERQQAAAKIAFLARHDPLTGLANRSMFQERLEQALALAGRGKGFALLCLDLDRFKAVNDTLGHPVGDALLRAVADRLRDSVRESDTVARLGGDEFAILLLDATELAETTAVAHRIAQVISDPFDLDGHQVSVGTSIGIAVAPRDGAHPAQLMQHADLALYRSKQERRGSWRYFEPAMDEVATARRVLEADLRSATLLQQLELQYQPLVCSRTRTVTGFEALLRWHHPDRGLVAPGEFISVAEEIGLIPEIGAWVLQQACAEAATWPDHLRVAVNLSARQFRGQALVGAVTDALQRSGLPARRLELEITESVPLQDDQATLSLLQTLHAFGTRIALDDFCTGYSSLSYLRSFPFDRIKIDRSFVSDLLIRDTSCSIVRGLIGLAASLRMHVTAEGVETERQYAFLADAGCTEIQGFLVSPPVAAREVPRLISLLSARLRFAAAAG